MSVEGTPWTLSGLTLAASGVAAVGILWYGGTVVPAPGTLRETAPPWVRLAVLSVGAGLSSRDWWRRRVPGPSGEPMVAPSKSTGPDRTVWASSTR